MTADAFPGAPKLARKVNAWLLREQGFAYSDIAAELGWADHSSAWDAVQRVESWRIDRPRFAAVLDALKGM
jgi:chromosomal replication initiation ATPase DnaA